MRHTRLTHGGGSKLQWTHGNFILKMSGESSRRLSPFTLPDKQGTPPGALWRIRQFRALFMAPIFVQILAQTLTLIKRVHKNSQSALTFARTLRPQCTHTIRIGMAGARTWDIHLVPNSGPATHTPLNTNPSPSSPACCLSLNSARVRGLLSISFIKRTRRFYLLGWLLMLTRTDSSIWRLTAC